MGGVVSIASIPVCGLKKMKLLLLLAVGVTQKERTKFMYFSSLNVEINP